MVYAAMFDKVDEATAIFKCSQQSPTGQLRLITEKGVSTDHYLWLTGQAAWYVHSNQLIPQHMPKRRDQLGHIHAPSMR
jgi:hypothetical protein